MFPAPLQPFHDQINDKTAGQGIDQSVDYSINLMKNKCRKKDYAAVQKLCDLSDGKGRL